MKFVCMVIVGAILILIVVRTAKYFHEEEMRTRQEVYSLLDKDYLSPEEKERIKFLTDPDEMKEGFIYLDEAHNKRYEYHFGHKR